MCYRGFPLKVDRIYPDQHDTVRLRPPSEINPEAGAFRYRNVTVLADFKFVQQDPDHIG